MSYGARYRFYKTKAWERARSLAMRRPVTMADGRVCPPLMCERCFRDAGELVPAQIVHHIEHVTDANVGDPRVTLDPANLMRVCRDCHESQELHPELYHKGETGPRVAFDETGRVVRRG